MSTDDTKSSKPQPSEKDAKAVDPRIKATAEAERIKELRERLYARGSTTVKTERHELPKHEIHDTMEKPKERIESSAPNVAVPPVVQVSEPQKTEAFNSSPEGDKNTILYSSSMATSRRKSLRKKIALGGVVFFVVAVALASLLMFSGNNTISGDNISVNVSGPISVGGGEEISFQVAVANQNAVPIQSASLIIEYPKGTHSIEDPNKELSVERKQLDTVGAGELLNIPLKARIFGEENEEKEIKISIDYRVAGSNATFHKEATPLKFKVSTSPIVMTFDSVKTISSGQELELKLTVQSNSPTPLTDILVKTTYPDGFDFTDSNPETVSGEDTWKIASLKAGVKKGIIALTKMDMVEKDS